MAEFSSRRRPRVGASACLLGHLVRYDGDHRLAPHIVTELSRDLALVAVCPEVELGLGVPRETIELIRRGGAVRLEGTRTRADLTDAMSRYAALRVEALAAAGLCGYVLKSRSPSCGPSVEIAGAEAGRTRGRGLFAAALMDRLPDIAIADDEALRDPEARRRFVARALACDAARR